MKWLLFTLVLATLLACTPRPMGQSAPAAPRAGLPTAVVETGAVGKAVQP